MEYTLPTKNFRALSSRIFQLANAETPRTDFINKVAKLLIEHINCNQIEFWMKESGTSSRCEVSRGTKNSFDFHLISLENEKNILLKIPYPSVRINILCQELLSPNLRKRFFNISSKKSLWRSDLEKACLVSYPGEEIVDIKELVISDVIKSFSLIPLIVADEIIGILVLKSNEFGTFKKERIAEFLEIAETVGIALLNQRAQAALKERIKELTCLYSLAQLAEHAELSIENIMQGIAELLPPGWQYPDITVGRIMLDGNKYSSSLRTSTNEQKQIAQININNIARGFIEVAYLEEKPELDEGPFLCEERNLINAISREVAHIVERKESERDRQRLQEQLLHADRLATIGQLAAGVAHELNEPLGNILGFAQLIKKQDNLPQQTQSDIEKVIAASLFAREVIKKLMLFARQTPPSKSQVDINKIIEEGISFFTSRCQKAGIDVCQLLAPNLPEITADSSQLTQVLVNLIVNAIQAMPTGGKLIIQTKFDENDVTLSVEDTGIGMSEEIQQQIFLPFFTTKDVDQGTGLGLAVAHGIVSSHKGQIGVKSELGKGSTFEVRLPISTSPNNKGNEQNGFEKRTGKNIGG